MSFDTSIEKGPHLSLIHWPGLLTSAQNCYSLTWKDGALKQLGANSRQTNGNDPGPRTMCQAGCSAPYIASNNCVTEGTIATSCFTDQRGDSRSFPSRPRLIGYRQGFEPGQSGPRASAITRLPGNR